jgi:hypothetical protein
VPVDGVDRLAAALAVARPGDHLLLADGTYDGELVAARDGWPRPRSSSAPSRPHAARIRARRGDRRPRLALGLTLEGAKVRLRRTGRG